MYLKRLYIENNGPLRQVSLELPFAANGDPKPIIMVGGNGSGKTNLLSIITDALFEAAAVHFRNVVPDKSGGSRPWFRFVGPRTISVGATGGCAILEFEHDGKSHFYKEKGGAFLADEVRHRLPEALRPAAAWEETGSFKEISISDGDAQKVFDQGAYVSFPASRAEMPHWLNRESLKTEEFDLSPRISGLLRKPIYVERGLEHIKQWLLALIIDTRMDISVRYVGLPPQPVAIPVGDPSPHIDHQMTWISVNAILRNIIGDQSVGFGWAGRNSLDKIVIHRNGSIIIPSIDGLSSGQATLLNIFCTLARYGDANQGALVLSQITGICLIDEIDAHIHIDLQNRALPLLIKMFPKVQFIVSSHSPLFVLGMEQAFGEEGIAIIDMPTATPVQAEAYSEFGRALEVLNDTKTFNAAIKTAIEKPGKMLVFLEGETDPKYFETAAELLGSKSLLDRVEFHWVGAKDPKSGQGFHTGTSALNTTLIVLRANPELVRRPVLLLHDNEVNKTPETHGDVHVRSMPKNYNNTMIEAGIENLLPEESISAEMFDKKEIKKPNGSKIITETLNKMKLCLFLCEEKRVPTDFENFAQVLNMIEVLLDPVANHDLIEVPITQEA